METHDGAQRPAHVNVVQYTLSCPTQNVELRVAGFEAIEQLNRPYHVTVDVEGDDDGTEIIELLGRDVRFAIAREQQYRELHGVVCRVMLHDTGEARQTATVEIAPALNALAFTRNTRIFQDQSALEIVEAVLGEALRPYERTFDSTHLVRDRYLARDYCVQYAETNLDFVHRLLEEEGIGYYFTQEGPEKLVLFSENRHCAGASTMDSGPVRYDPSGREWVDAEPLLRLASIERTSSTSMTLRDHDWTRGRPTLEATARFAEPERVNADIEHEDYEHGFRRSLTIRENEELLAALIRTAQTAILPDGLPPGVEHMVLDLNGAVLGGFSTSDISHQLTIRTELAKRDARCLYGVSLVTDFAAGKSFEVAGHPTHGADGGYLLTKVTHSSRHPALPGDLWARNSRAGCS